jgi:predicted NBD/HSP70 family sugar kinase
MRDTSTMPRNVSPLSVHDVRPLNRAAMLAYLRRHGATTRGVLSRELHLSNSAVTNVAAELLSDGVLVDRASDGNGSPRLGRPSTELSIAADSRFVIGVQVSVGTVRVGFCDLLGRVPTRTSETFDVSADPEPALEAIVRAIKRLLRRRSAAALLGIGVGAPGPVDTAGRVNLMSINLGWVDVPFAERLEAAFDLPVVVDHNVRAMALAEARYGRSKGVESLAFIYVRSGVGAGLVMDGKPYRGGTLGVTEFGHLPIIEGGPRCTCGNQGCLEAVASEPALARAVEAAARKKGTALSVALDSGQTPMQALISAARDGDAAATRIWQEFTAHLAAGLVSLVNLLNPELVVVGGLPAEAGDELLTPLREEVGAHVFPMLRDSINIQRTSFADDSGVVGAAAVALDALFYEPPLRHWIQQRQRVPLAPA